MCGLKQEALALELGADWNQKRISLLEDAGAINIIASTVNHNDQSASVFYNAVINSTEKWLEALEENKKLYGRLLQSEREKVELLERLLNERR